MFTPKRLDRALSPHADVAPHASFLERAQAEHNPQDETCRGAPLGAYPVARLVDRLLEFDGSAEAEDGLRWQREGGLDRCRVHGVARGGA